jgi:hypothetical protein
LGSGLWPSTASTSSDARWMGQFARLPPHHTDTHEQTRRRVCSVIILTLEKEWVSRGNLIAKAGGVNAPPLFVLPSVCAT